jgi:hypothetical protein
MSLAMQDRAPAVRDPHATSAAVAALTARFGNRVVTSRPVRE